MTRITDHANDRTSAVTYFISDLHLSAQEPAITNTLREFLNNEARQADALYILGDLYDYWLGDNTKDPFECETLAMLRDFIRSGVPTYFINGNRDFLIGRRFAKLTGIQRLPLQCHIRLYGKPVLIMHGDSLCCMDRLHQIYRRISHHPVISLGASLTPRFIRLCIAKFLRHRSQQHQARVADYILDVSPTHVMKAMQKHHVQTLIHGHTHRPAIHEFMLNNQNAKRIVLGAWHNSASILAYHADGKLALRKLPLVHD